MSLFKRKQATKVEYTLKLDENAAKFIELMGLSYDERRLRALELLGDKWFDTLLFRDNNLMGLQLAKAKPVYDPSGKVVEGVDGKIEFGEDHVAKLLKLSFPYKEYNERQALKWVKDNEGLSLKPNPPSKS